METRPLKLQEEFLRSFDMKHMRIRPAFTWRVMSFADDTNSTRKSDPVRESLQSSVGTLTLPPDCKILDVAQPSYRKRLYVLCGTVSTRHSHSHPHTLKLSPLRFSVVLESITGKKTISLSNLILV